MSEESHSSQSHVQQVIFNLAAFSIVVAGMKLASEILIPFLLAIFISVIANPLVTKLRNKGLPILGAILVVILGIISLGIAIASLLGTSLSDFRQNLPQYKEMVNNSAEKFFDFFQIVSVVLKLYIAIITKLKLKLQKFFEKWIFV